MIMGMRSQRVKILPLGSPQARLDPEYIHHISLPHGKYSSSQTLSDFFFRRHGPCVNYEYLYRLIRIGSSRVKVFFILLRRIPKVYCSFLLQRPNTLKDFEFSSKGIFILSSNVYTCKHEPFQTLILGPYLVGLPQALSTAHKINGRVRAYIL